MDSIFGGSHALDLPGFAAAGVENLDLVVLIDGAAGKNTAACPTVIVLAGSNAFLRLFPMDHITAGAVAPEHLTPGALVGLMLAEHMVGAISADQATGVIDPAGGHHEMVMLSPLGSADMGVMLLHKLIDVVQNLLMGFIAHSLYLIRNFLYNILDIAQLHMGPQMFDRSAASIITDSTAELLGTSAGHCRQKT